VFDSPNLEPHNLGLAAISTAPSGEIMKRLIQSVLMWPHFALNFMDVVELLLHIHFHCLIFFISFKLYSCSFQLFVRVCSRFFPTSHRFILLPPYVLLLWFINFVSCNTLRRSLPFFNNKVESCMSYGLGELTLLCVVERARSGTKTFAFIAWEYNALEADPRWS